MSGQWRSIRKLCVSAAVLLAIGACSVPKPLQQVFDFIDPRGNYGEPDVKYSATGAEIQEGQPRSNWFRGLVSADEPRAAEAGRAMLARGGDAADAAVAAYFVLAVTYPSGAGLGGSGQCLMRMPGGAVTQISFQGLPDAHGIAAPGNIRGMALVHALYGKLRWGEVLSRAEFLARTGFALTRASARSIQAAGDKILKDPGAAAVFAGGGNLPGEGAMIIQSRLAETLARIRVGGTLDQSFKTREDVSPAQGRPASHGTWYEAKSWGGQDPEPLAASTIVAADSAGGAVACTVSLGQVFGDAYFDTEYGFARMHSEDLRLSPIIVSGEELYFAGAAAGQSGHDALSKAAAAAQSGGNVSAALKSDKSDDAAAALYCRAGLPSSPSSCGAIPDPRGAGMALVAEQAF